MTKRRESKSGKRAGKGDSGPAAGVDRYERGLRRVEELDGQDGVEWADDLRSFSPDFERFVVETAYGNVWCRSGLSARDREIATIAALIAMGNSRPELVSHMVMGRKIGITRDEIIEIIFQMTIYAGFPVAIEALTAAREVFADRKHQDP